MSKTKIKLCGLTCPKDVVAANTLKPDYVGFVLFFEKSVRNITVETAVWLKAILDPEIQAVGVFVDAPLQAVADLLNRGVIDLAQLHGSEDEAYIAALRELTGKPIIKAFQLRTPEDAARAQASSADLVLLDSGTGTGQKFDWTLAKAVQRPCLLAGGLNPDNVAEAMAAVAPFGVDVSSGIETDKRKDETKMRAFVESVRRQDERS